MEVMEVNNNSIQGATEILHTSSILTMNLYNKPLSLSCRTQLILTYILTPLYQSLTIYYFIDHSYAIPSAREQINQREYLHDVIDQHKLKIARLRGHKRKLQTNTKILASKLAEVENELSCQVRY